jgi:hypothetical protein
MKDKNSMEQAREMALFKFSLIAPVIQGTLSDESAKAYYKRITVKPLQRPDGTEFLYSYKTLEKWTSNYLKDGFSALTPKVRSDKGVVKRLSGECITEIYRIKEQFPKLNATQIHLRLIDVTRHDKIGSPDTQKAV